MPNGGCMPMATLRELQSDMLEALFERSDRVARQVVPRGLAPQRRLDIYRHNLFGSLTDALAAVYPTVAALVGDGFFRYAAHEFIVAHPSRSGNLHEFGGELPDFVERFEPARVLPYLADSARLDWAWHAVFHTESAPCADARAVLAQIAAMPDHARLAMCLGWQPAARIVASRYPILRIWQVHQLSMPDDDSPLVDLDAGGESVLVVQRAGEVVLERLTPAEHALLHGLSRRALLGEAVAAALAIDAGFDVAGTIAHHLAVGTLVFLEMQAA
jgi:hypothetical protein